MTGAEKLVLDDDGTKKSKEDGKKEGKKDSKKHGKKHKKKKQKLRNPAGCDGC